ncbi:PASTA domain-containing protein [Herbidospora sp. NEAU-GS84]|uniref:PASTA domain-containing protein n=1 Tax=Herbidospora solisilvae TaxID=2696284 RepID=A0A7C9NHB2_9ACTN|nr:PASTA domain-containing protein [Herbidospora solisilvae]NAS25115.1 PASTA domain-containing protein [Herbidospora solisilvae]
MNLIEVEVPDFRGMQALNAWLVGHDAGVLLIGPSPDGPESVMHGIVTRQEPLPGARVSRWDTVKVWMRDGGGGSAGVREPRTPKPPAGGLAEELPDH